ncbi:MAG: GldG family protein [Bradymonadaceae bacterium]|nr:GldG family protein [Lujinxingiaceae bacterium]
MADKAQSHRKLVSGANAAVLVAATLAIAIVANAISSQFFTRFDLTDNQIFTLSEASKQAVSGLDETVEVRAFISPNMAPPFHNLSQQLADLLSEYAAASDGKLKFRIINPEDDEATEEAARGFGIEKVGIGQRTENEVSLRAVYKGIAFVKGEQTEVIRDLHTTGRPEYDNFEYEFTKSLLNLRRAAPQKVGFLGGFGGPGGHPQFIESLKPAFEQLYGSLIEVEMVDLSEATSVAADIAALVVLNIEQPLNDGAKFAVDQFIARGGSVGWYQSSSVIDQQLQQQIMQQMGVQPGQRPPEIRKGVDTNLNDLFGHYGIQFRRDVVLDRENSLAMSVVMTSQGLAQVSHPGTFALTDIDSSLPFSRDFGTLALPVPSSLLILPKARENKDLEVFEVIKTSESAVRRLNPPIQLGYDQFVDPEPGEERGPFILAAAIQGKIPSYYQDNPLPAGVTEADMAKTSAPARLLVVGSGEFFMPMRQVGYDDRLSSLGAQFFIGSIEWLVADNSLTQIRGKAMPRLIGEVGRDTQRRLQFINIIVVPALFAAIGSLMMIRRRRRKEHIARISERLP